MANSPSTMEERLPRIEAMNRRINAYVRFMCKAGNLNGTSAEAKDKAVAAFYERMAALERQLGRIQEDLQIGGGVRTAATPFPEPATPRKAFPC